MEINRQISAHDNIKNADLKISQNLSDEQRKENEERLRNLMEWLAHLDEASRDV